MYSAFLTIKQVLQESELGGCCLVTTHPFTWIYQHGDPTKWKFQVLDWKCLANSLISQIPSEV